MTEQQQEGPQFVIESLYIKDVSFESPYRPQEFNHAEKQPDVNIDLNCQNENLGDNRYEVVLNVNVTVKIGDRTAFVTEVKEAGIFQLQGFEGEVLEQVLGSYCPNVLFPYARERISSLVTSGGFPQLILAPVNFDAIFQQQREQQSKQ